MQQTTSARNPSYFDYCLITSAPKPYCILTVKIGVLWCERFERLLYCASVHVRFFEKINEYESAVGSCQFESLHRKASDFEKASDGRFYLTVIQTSNSPFLYI
ncbi:hypothetical protein T4B_6891 [Trichinella pseudospiralis]|uniref:Uncharacterized protein n=1 Tax=Trichinella pseudospiralis TaxID=6337 RepID=A0A0V1IMN3_TRIPS|nr:hypothetical protein T4B_6891 [Trichinella pseudospiralis]